MTRAQSVALAFDLDGVNIRLDKILPLKKVLPNLRNLIKYRQIAASIEQIGVIEPLIVYPEKGKEGHFILLDGLMRYDILQQRGATEVFCLIATDDEAFTYNHKVNRLSPIQEHLMILRAAKNGVPEDRIAATLNVDVSQIRQRMDLLKGICPEAVDLLKDKYISARAIWEFRKVKPLRQIEMADLMRATGNFSTSYAKCLLAATPEDQLADGEGAKRVPGLSAEDMARMEREMEGIGRDFHQIEETHGRNVLNLVICVGYLRKLLDNARVVRYLSQRHADILSEFQKIADITSLVGEEAKGEQP